MPHVIARPSGARRKVVVVGAGPAGLEAARVAGERGHEVVVFEAADQAGGQIRLQPRRSARREMIGIIDWRLAECARARRRVPLQHSGRAPTTCWPRTPTSSSSRPAACPIPSCSTPAPTSSRPRWDILVRRRPSRPTAFCCSTTTAHMQVSSPPSSSAKPAAGSSSQRPSAAVGPDVGGLNYPAIPQGLRCAWHRHHPQRAARDGHAAMATRWSRRCSTTTSKKRHRAPHRPGRRRAGTLPLDELYFALKPLSRNLGEVDQAAFVAHRPQTLVESAAEQVPAVPDRRRRGVTQHPRRDLRRNSLHEGPVRGRSVRDGDGNGWIAPVNASCDVAAAASARSPSAPSRRTARRACRSSRRRARSGR